MFVDEQPVAEHGDAVGAGQLVGHEVDLAIGVAPNLLCGGLAVDFGVGRVLELLRDEMLLRVGGRNFLGLANGAGHALGAQYARVGGYLGPISNTIVLIVLALTLALGAAGA